MSTVEDRLKTHAPLVAASGRATIRPAREHLGAAQRMRIISAMAALAYRHGATSMTISELVSFASVSRKTFYDLFEDRSECLLAAIEHALALASERAGAAYDRDERWVDRVRAGLAAALQFFDEEPQLAHVCLVESAAAGPAALVRRAEVLGRLACTIDEGRALARRQPPPLTAEGVVGGVLSVVSARLVDPDSGPLVDLVNPLMSVIVLPYRGNAAARKELSRCVPRRVAPARQATPDPFEGLPMRVTHRTVAVLAAIAAEPGLSNFEVSERAGIIDQGQISKLLARLSNLGLAENTGGGQPMGVANSWQLTRKGHEVEEAIRQALRRLGGGPTRDATMAPTVAV